MKTSVSISRIGLTQSEIQDALAMWKSGRDTLDIAKVLAVHESVIYASLPRWRLALQNARAA